MSVGDAHGPTADLDEVPGPPVPFGLAIDDRPRQADGRSLHAVRTDELVDRFGNVLLDGTAVTLIVDETTGRRQAVAVTIEGRAEFAVESPAAPGPIRMWAESAGVSSTELAVDFEAAVTDWPTALARNGDRWRLDVGPVRTVDAGFVPDGTLAVLAGTDIALEAMIVDGIVSFDLTNPPAADVRVTILGVTNGIDR
jgi:hypothetical protein